jgi:hypothetical protein
MTTIKLKAERKPKSVNPVAMAKLDYRPADAEQRWSGDVTQDASYANRQKSKVRTRIAGVFDAQEISPDSRIVQTLSPWRGQKANRPAQFACNICRHEALERLAAAS